MIYRLTVIPRAVKDLDKLKGKLFTQITEAIQALADDPRPPGSLKLSDEENGYRVRVRNIRILYRVDDRAKEVIVYRVKHRREVYRS
ncbi:MAG: type II toxin-antitoxin system RelE/ParE family toxin [Nitrospirales bacterium]|nr:type II toxin-antitoxin system RelE/ParE family toxin [Nitrospirales bacterium]